MIKVSQLTKSLGSVKAVDNISFNVSDNDSLVVFGPSGSGKTTLLRLISGLEVPDNGEIYIDDVLASKNDWILEPHKRNLGFVFQAPTLWPHMTVARNILFGLNDLPKQEARNRLRKVLEQTSLTGLEHRYPHQISGGEARRVALARTLAPRPKYLLLDEPLTNLDRELRKELLSLVKSTVKNNKQSMIYVTHEIDEAELISEKVLFLKEGRIED